MGKYSKHSQQLQNEVINLPDNVEVNILCYLIFKKNQNMYNIVLFLGFTRINFKNSRGTDRRKNCKGICR